VKINLLSKDQRVQSVVLSVPRYLVRNHVFPLDCPKQPFFFVRSACQYSKYACLKNIAFWGFMDSAHIHGLLVLAFFSLGMLWVAVPMGLAMGLNPFMVACIAVPCSILGAACVIVLIRPLRDWVRKRYSERNKRGHLRLIFRVWRKAGLPGIGLLGPLLVGPPPTMAVGLLMGAKPAKLLAWTSAGILLWTTFMEVSFFFGKTWFS